MWYEQSYTVRFTTLLRSVGIIFNETFGAFFQTERTDFFAVLLAGVLFWFVAGLLLYMMRKTKKL